MGKAFEYYNRLDWVTLSEYGFYVERSSEGKTFEDLGFVRGKGNSTSANNYTFKDENPLMQLISYYRLRQVDFNGKENYTKVIALGNAVNYLIVLLYFLLPSKINLTFYLKHRENTNL